MAQRDPNGQITRRERKPREDVGPTPEMRKRREDLFGSRTATGEIDCALDVLAGAECRLITEKQAEAGRRYAMARMFALRAAGINPGPAGAALSEWIDSPRTPPDVPDDGKSAYRWRKARQAVYDCGADVRRIVDQVCVDNVPPRTHQVERLRIGLDALIRLWRL
jgi:hypothetical protein